MQGEILFILTILIARKFLFYCIPELTCDSINGRISWNNMIKLY